MTQQVLEPVRQINQLEVGEEGGVAAAQSRNASLLAKRVRRRRANLKTLRGIAAEQARVYRQLLNGSVAHGEAEHRRKHLRSLAETLTVVEQQEAYMRLVSALQLAAPDRAAAYRSLLLGEPAQVTEVKDGIK